MDSSESHWMVGLGNDNMKHYLLIIMVLQILDGCCLVFSHFHVISRQAYKILECFIYQFYIPRGDADAELSKYLVLSISFSNISVSTRPILEKQSNQLIRGNAKVSKDFAEEN